MVCVSRSPINARLDMRRTVLDVLCSGIEVGWGRRSAHHHVSKDMPKHNKHSVCVVGAHALQRTYMSSRSNRRALLGT